MTILLWMRLGCFREPVTKARFKNHDRNNSFWLLATTANINLIRICQAAIISITCHLPGRSLLISVTVLETGLWEWWWIRPAGRTTIWAFLVFLVLSPRSWAVIVTVVFLFRSKIFVYSWSLPRKFWNCVLRSLNGNLILQKLSSNGSGHRSEGLD